MSKAERPAAMFAERGGLDAATMSEVVLDRRTVRHDSETRGVTALMALRGDAPETRWRIRDWALARVSKTLLLHAPTLTERAAGLSAVVAIDNMKLTAELVIEWKPFIGVFAAETEPPAF